MTFENDENEIAKSSQDENDAAIKVDAEVIFDEENRIGNRIGGIEFDRVITVRDSVKAGGVARMLELLIPLAGCVVPIALVGLFFYMAMAIDTFFVDVLHWNRWLVILAVMPLFFFFAESLPTLFVIGAILGAIYGWGWHWWQATLLFSPGVFLLAIFVLRLIFGGAMLAGWKTYALYEKSKRWFMTRKL